MTKTHLIALAAILLAVLLSASAVKADQYGDFTYTTNNGTITITGYDCSLGAAVTNPSVITGLLVTSIGDKAIEGCTILKSFTIPASVTSIGSVAVVGCVCAEALKEGMTK